VPVRAAALRLAGTPLALAGATAVVVLACAGGLLAIDAVRDALGAGLSGDTGRLRTELDALGATAALVIVGLTLLHIVVPFPAEIATAAAGFVFGVVIGIPFMLAAWLLSGMVAYGVAQVIGRPVLARLAGARRLQRTEEIVGGASPGVLLTLRFIPIVPFTLLCFACGVARVPIRRFAWTTLVGIIPITTLSAVLGARLQEPSLTDPVLLGALLGFAALSLLVHPLRRRLRPRDPDTTTR
jgi:uncharacterized membrane protein YdjX (TVP38/TMEM64 family)